MHLNNWVNGYIEEGRELLHSKVLKDTGWVIFGEYGALFLAFISTTLVARFLGPELFGLFSVFYATRAITSSLSDLGLDSSLIKFGSYYINKNQNKAQYVMKLITKTKLITYSIITALGFIFAEKIALIFFSTPELTFIIRFSFIFIFISSILGTFIAIFKVKQNFWKMALLQISRAAFLLTAVIFLYLSLKLTVQSVIFSHLIVTALAVIIGSRLINFKFLTEKYHNKKLAKKIIYFSKWTYLKSIFNVISSQTGIYFLIALSSSIQAGYYSAAQHLTIAFSGLISIIVTVLIPRVSKYSTKKEIVRYIKKTYKITLPLTSVLIIFILFISPYAISIIYGNKYEGAILLFKILAVTLSIQLITLPIGLLLNYTLNKPNHMTLLQLIKILISFPLFFLILPKYGALGFVIVFAIANILISITSNLICLKLLVNKYKKLT
jgi:O-antigen/teichoic acid export membrane protein